MRLLLSLLGIVVSVASSAALAKPLLFGVANASFQVEGSPADSDWRRWTRTPGKIKDGTNADVAAGFWTRYEEDFRTARATGMNAFRIALAWERINPALGRWDEAALDRYAAMIASMRAHGLEPVVTLHHYVLPAWLAEKGGVLAPDYADRFAEYAVKAISRLSSVRYWMTTNEPYILAREAYIDGNYPPGHHSTKEALAAIASLARAHVRAARALEAAGLRTIQLGFATCWEVLDLPAADRARLEQLCRYLLRPAVAQDRLRQLDDGRVVLTLKSPWADGTRQLLFEPLTLLEKLAALIPRPRINLVLYHGVLAPHAGWRARVVTYGVPPAVASPCSEASDTSKSGPRHWAWAALMRRAFDLDVLACPRCGGRLRLIATVEDPEAIRAILGALGGWREREGRVPPGAAGAPPSPAGVLGA